jgi:hypothetical protein
MAIGLIAAGLGAIGGRKNKKELEKTLKNAPKYEMQEEAAQNQAIARSEAYGRDAAIQTAESKLEQDASNAVAQAKDVTSSTSGLLSTIAAIQANQTTARQGLAQDEAMLRNQKIQTLMGVNNAMIDEKDKAWNYNVNMPYQMKVASLRDRKKANDELVLAGVEAQATTDAAAIQSVGQMFGGMGGMMSDERVKHDVTESKYGLKEVMNLRSVEFKYNWEEQPHVGFIAQEVQSVIPEVVVGMDSHVIGVSDPLMINMHEIVPVLVKAIQQQQEQIMFLRKELESIKIPA